MIWVFAAVPAVFTKTAVEAMIQDQGFAAQASIAAILRGTPVLVALGAVAWAVYVWRAMLAMTIDGRSTGSVLYRLFMLTLLMLFSWTLLGLETSTGMSSGPLDSPDREQAWADLPGVGDSDHYDRLRTPSKALWGFAMVNGVYEELSALLTGAIGVTPEKDPGEMIKSLVKLQATTLGEADSGQEVLSAFDALARNCGRSDARVLAQGGLVKDLFVTTVDPIGTDPDGTDVDCAMLWTDFEEASASVAASNYSGGGAQAMAGQYGWQRFLDLGREWYGLDDEEATQWATNALIEGTVRDAARRSASGMNPLRKDEATFSEGWPDYILDVMVDGAIGEAALNAGSLFDPNIHLRAQKAEAAKRFNEIADLIPTLRGFLHAAFAVAFPLCAYAMALGWMGPMKNWLVGRGVLAMYMPAAHLLYSMVSEFAGYNALASNPDYAWLSSQQSVVGALAVMEAETLRVQTAYLICEVAVFGSFAVGSARSLLLGGISGTSSGAMGVGGAMLGGLMAGTHLARKLSGGASIAGTTARAATVGRAVPGVGPALAAGTSVVITAVSGTRRHAPSGPSAVSVPRTF